MVDSLIQRLRRQAVAMAGRYFRLILVVGPPRSGKTAALRALGSEEHWPLLNVNRLLSEKLLALTSRQRALQVPRLLEGLMDEHGCGVVLLDNTEVLFDPRLQQDPLRLLQGLARNRTVMASWAGAFGQDGLTYAVPEHPEFWKYRDPEAAIEITQSPDG